MSIPLFKVFMAPEAPEAASKTLSSGWIGQGPQVEAFEDNLSQFLKYKHLITTNSATSALGLALRLAGVSRGETVISSPLTFIATNTSILDRGAVIQWADIDPNTCNVDIDDIVEKVSYTTAAIMLVHWGGIPVDIETLEDRVFDKLGRPIPIIEDCAHSFGATYKDGSMIGTDGNYCAFSFQAIKHLTTVDGGMLTLPKSKYRRGKLLRWYGFDRDKKKRDDFRVENPVEEWGYKSHMNDVAASIGIENLKYIPKNLQKIRKNADYYNKQLKDIDGIELFNVPAESLPSYWLYTIKVDNRNDFIAHMKDNGIMTSKVHERNDNHPCFSIFRTDLPGLNLIEDKYICIPVGWWIDKEDREYIVDTIRRGW